MNDPHVEKLVYHIETGDGLRFQDPPPLVNENEAFRMTLEDGITTFSMKEHHATERSAKGAVEGYLRAWELDVALQYDRSELRFIYDEAEIVDRNPPPPPPDGAPQTIEVPFLDAQRREFYTPRFIVRQRQYPQPPRDLVADTDATTMWEQYERYKQGRDRLLPMAYSCLTRLEHRARTHPGKGGARAKAASMYGVDYEVLDKLGQLATTLGDEVEARKLGPQSELRAPTAQEVSWIEAALRLLVRRVGQYGADPQRAWPQLTMADLPELT